MHRDEAIARAVRLKGLMPRMTDQQVTKVRDLLLAHELANADAAIDRYVVTATDFEISKFVEMLPPRSPPGELPADRTKRELRQEAKSTAQLEAYWKEVESFIGSLTDEQLAAAKAETIAEMKPQAAELLGKLDPRKWRSIKGAIFDRMARNGGLVNA